MKIARILAATLLATTAAAADAKTVVVTAAHMIDVLAGKRIDDPQVTIVDGRITAVGRKGDAVPAGAERVDLGTRTLLPGLIDMHVHLTSDPTLSGYRTLEFTDNFWTVVGVANARRTLDAGFTYALGATGGHCDATEFPPSITVPHPQIANTPDEFRGAVRTIRKYGAEVVKVCMTGGVLSKTDSVGAQQISLAEIKAIVEEAHMLGMKVAVHAHGAEGINDALRAGVDTIEHASLADAESFRLAKASGAWFDMDIYDDDYILAEGAKNGVFPESLEKERQVGLKQRQTFRAAHAAGVKMLFGTDGGVYPNGNNALQFAKMVEWGMTPIEAIQAATSSAAIALAKTNDVGAIQPGRFGDIIAVDGDPLADVRQLEHPSFVMKGGAVVIAPR
jgi:imidazolonepropionase-like amidohydrolase